MATARALQLLPAVEDELVPVSRIALDRLVENIDSLADDLDAGLEAIASRIFAGSRPAAINEINRLGLRVARLRRDFEPIGGKPTEPRPLRLA